MDEMQSALVLAQEAYAKVKRLRNSGEYMNIKSYLLFSSCCIHSLDPKKEVARAHLVAVQHAIDHHNHIRQSSLQVKTEILEFTLSRQNKDTAGMSVAHPMDIDR